MTPTFVDDQLLQQQVADALSESSGAYITLPRSTVELMACVLEQAAGAEQPALASRYNISTDELRPAVIAEMQRLATREGVSPSKSRWDAQRRRGLPSAQHICRVLAVRWPVLATEAGLRLSPKARRYADELGEAQQTEASVDEPARVEPDDDKGCLVVSSRTETVTVGNLRITREYHMLR